MNETEYFSHFLAAGVSTEEDETKDAPVETLFTDEVSRAFTLNLPRHNSLRNSLLNCLECNIAGI